MKKLLVTLGLAASIGVALPARNASATYYDYCGGLVNPHSWCWTGYWGGLITWNRANYPGSANLRIGIQSYYNFGGYYLCRHMGYGYVAATCYVNGGQVGVANGSDNRHTVQGKVNVCWGCQLSRTTSPGPAPDPEVPRQTTLDEIAQMPFNLDAQKARRVLRDDDKASFFVVPGGRQCLFREGQWDEFDRGDLRHRPADCRRQGRGGLGRARGPRPRPGPGHGHGAGRRHRRRLPARPRG